MQENCIAFGKTTAYVYATCTRSVPRWFSTSLVLQAPCYALQLLSLESRGDEADLSVTYWGTYTGFDFIGPVPLHTAPVYPRWYTCVAFVMLPFHTPSRGRAGDDNAVPRTVYLAGECTRVPHANRRKLFKLHSQKTEEFLHFLEYAIFFKFRNLFNCYNELYITMNYLKKENIILLHMYKNILAMFIQLHMIYSV